MLKRVKSTVIAEDLTQEVFLKITKSDPEYVIDSIRAWTFSVARNTLIDHYRKDHRVGEEFNEELHGPLNIENQTTDELSSCIINMMSNLSSEEENILKSIDLDGLSQKELSEKLGINYTTLKSKVRRARKNLNGKLTDCCHFKSDSRGNTSFCEKK